MYAILEKNFLLFSLLVVNFIKQVMGYIYVIVTVATICITVSCSNPEEPSGKNQTKMLNQQKVAEYERGVKYETGDGIPQDYVEASIAYRRAADAGLSQAQRQLGFLYANGLGVPKDDVEAVRWFRLGAEQNDAKAQFNLGLMYQLHRGVTLNDIEGLFSAHAFVQAAYWYQRAIKNGDRYARHNLTALTSGIPPNVIEPLMHIVSLMHNANDGDVEAMVQTGKSYLNGKIVGVNLHEAEHWLMLAYKHGYRKAGVLLEDIAFRLNLSGQLSFSSGNLEEAKRNNLKSAYIFEKLGNKERLGPLYASLAAISKNQGNIEQSCEYAYRSRDLFTASKNALMIAEAWKFINANCKSVKPLTTEATSLIEKDTPSWRSSIRDIVDSNIVIICIGYICFLSLCIGLYVGFFGFEGFARPRPIGLFITTLCMLGAFLLLYVQEKYGFKAQPKHIGIVSAFFLIALVIGKCFRLKYYSTGLQGKEAKMSSTMTITEKAGILWRQGLYGEARILYQNLLSEIIDPMDKAKLLTNIAQIYEKEGSQVEAIDYFEDALRVINENKLYESLEGSHLRGYLNGLLNRLKGKHLWAPPEYDGSIPAEMNLSIYGRLRAHFSVAVIGAGISGTIVAQISMPYFDSIWPKGPIVFSWIVGFVIGLAVTSKMIKQVVNFLCIITKKSALECLKPAVHLLTGIAIIYIALMPFLFEELVKEVILFITTAFLGVVFFGIFISRRHAKRIE